MKQRNWTAAVLLAVLSGCGGSDRAPVVAPPIVAPPPPVVTPMDPWTAIGPGPAAIQAPVAVHTPSKTMFVATLGGGLFKASIGTGPGSTVGNADSGLNSRVIGALAMVPHDPNTLYAGTTLGGIYKTIDGGANWNITGETGAITLFLAVDPVNTNIVYAGYNNAVPLKKSTDGGTTWVAASSGIPNTSVFTIAIDPSNPSILYAGTTGNGAFKSINGGTSWTPINIASTVWTLWIDPAAPSTIYAGTDGDGVLKSTDGGANFDRLGALPVNVVLSLVKIGNRLVAGTASRGAFFSDNDGTTWQSTNLTEGLILSLSAGTDGFLAAGTAAQGLYVSEDRGQTWQWDSNVNYEAGCYCQNGHAIAVSPRNGTLYFGTNDGGLFESDNSGDPWYRASINGLTTRSPRSIAFHPTDPQRIYVGSFIGGGFFKTADGGQTWQRRRFGPPNVHVTGVAVSSDGGSIYASTLGGAGIWKSVDDGETFQRIDVGVPGGPFLNLAGRGIAVRPSSDTVFFAGGSGVWRSLDRGALWTRVSTIAGHTITVHPVDPNIVYVGTQTSGVLKSTDGGATFALINTGLTELRTGRTGGVQIQAARPDTLYVNTEGGGIFKSRDAGGSWVAVNGGLTPRTDLFVYGLAIDPSAEGVLYASTSSSVFKTTTGGE
jgi:photosystem II stability/assembly factor-like uncharacterized protein